jgi:hypothetical protein
VGNAPTNLDIGATVNLSVTFDALPDPVDVEALAPRFFHRFEQGFTDTNFFDASAQHADIALAALAVTNRPHIVYDNLRRDRALVFDGDDFASVPGQENFPNDFSISLWVNPASTADGQNFIGKHSTAGGNRFIFGFFGGGYRVDIRGAAFTGGTKKAGWQHLAVTAARTPTNTTFVTLYRDGEILWQANLAQLLGNAAGYPWILGGDWDSATTVNDFLTGQLDDVGLFDRALTESEVQTLASKSPVCGDHFGRLVFQTDSESGERGTELRAAVQETAGTILIETVPPGAAVTVDGVSYPTPVSFAVGCTAATPKEWLEGSQHVIVAPTAVALAANGRTLTYGFADWSLQNASTRTLSIVARPNLGRVTARYRLDGISPPAGGLAGASAGEEEPLIQLAGLPPDLNTLVAGTPAGPWFRLTTGRVDIPNLGANGFNITGDLMASLSRIKGSVSSSALNWPATGTPFLELGPGEWQVDVVAGDHFRMRTRPPSLALLGYDVAPDGEFQLNFDLQANLYTASFDLRHDFRPVPDFFEIGRNASGRAGASLTVVPGINPAFALQIDGRVHVLKIPNGVTGQNGWAVERDVALNVNTADFNLSLKDNVVGAANWPPTFFSGGPFALAPGTGDVRLARANNGPITLLVTNVNLTLNGQLAATVSGSVNTATELSLGGTIAGSTDLRLLSSTRFTLASRDGNPLAFDLAMRALPSPQFKLNLPAAKLRCQPGGNVSALEVNVPKISFDTAGTFDTGKIALPGGVSFDGIGINKPSGADLDKNYIRLKRDSSGKVVFKLRAQQLFEIDNALSCRNDLKVTIDNGVSASYRGDFCVLPESISLDFNGSSSCQFSGSAFGQTIFFGDNCVGVRNDATGSCLGTCQ